MYLYESRYFVLLSIVPNFIMSLMKQSVTVGEIGIVFDVIIIITIISIMNVIRHNDLFFPSSCKIDISIQTQRNRSIATHHRQKNKSKEGSRMRYNPKTGGSLSKL